MKRITSAVAAIIAFFVLFTGCGNSGSGGNNYEYYGFVIDVYENARGETVIVTVSDDVESEFVITPNTEISAPVKTQISVGDYVQLTTTRSSDTDIKKMKVSPGYFTEGRLVYVEGEESPFVLTEMREDGTRLFVRLVDNKGTLPGISGMGDIIKVYHSSQVSLDNPSATVEAITFLKNGTAADISEEDRIFIVSQGYMARAE